MTAASEKEAPAASLPARRGAFDGMKMIAIAIAFWSVPLGCLLYAQHDPRRRCIETSRSAQWCFDASELPPRSHGTCGERRGDCEVTRASYARVAPNALLSPCRPSREIWSVQYFDLEGGSVAQRHWSPDERSCLSYRAHLAAVSRDARPGPCVDDEEARLRSCLDFEAESARLRPDD